VISSCYHKSTDVGGCYDKATPEDGTPNQRELRKNSKESMIEQGEKMRRTATSQPSGGKKKPIAAGTVVHIKVDRVDRGTLDPSCMRRVVCEVTEHGNYHIACNGGVLKDCLAWGQC
jgi:hypothetical protein